MPARDASATFHDPIEWREHVSLHYAPIHLDADRDTSFTSRRLSLQTGEFDLTEIAGTAQTVHRTASLARTSRVNDCAVYVQLEGTGRILQGGREAVLGAGDFAPFDMGHPGVLRYDGDFSILALKFDARYLGLTPGQLQAIGAVPFTESNAASAVIRELLIGSRGLESPSMAHQVLKSTIDILSRLFREQLEPAPRKESDAGLLVRITEDLKGRLGDPEMSLENVAQQHFISVRKLHQLFQAEGTSPGRWIKDQRLLACRRELADPALAGRSISETASRWGYNNHSHFSYIFQAEFGMSPKAYRAAAGTISR